MREPFDASKPTIHELIEASSLGTPEAKALREEGRRILSGEESLTGMPEEQADWDGELVAGSECEHEKLAGLRARRDCMKRLDGAR